MSSCLETNSPVVIELITTGPPGPPGPPGDGDISVTSVNGRTGAVALTKADVGLSNVDNTSDLNKPVSSATATALSSKANAAHTHAIGDITNLTAELASKQATLVSGTNIKTVNGTSLLGSGDIVVGAGGNWGNIGGTLSNQMDLQNALNTKAPMGHTHDSATTSIAGFLSATDKSKLDGIAAGATANQPDAVLLGRANHTGTQAISTITGLQTALDGKQTALGFTPENAAQKNQPNGYVGLDSSTLIPSLYLPSYVDDVLEFANLAAFPGTGATGKIYVTLDTNKQYRWSGSVYVELTASPGSTDAVPEGSGNLYFTAARVLATILTGLSTATNAAITAGDTVLSALGKLQRQITDALTAISGKQDADADLTAIAALTPNNDDVLQRKAGNWVNRTIAQLRTDFGLAAIATSGSASDLGSGAVPLARLSGITATELSATAGITNGQLAGAIALSKLAITGTPDGTKFLRGDGSWQAVSGGGSPGGSSGDIQYNNAGAFGGSVLKQASGAVGVGSWAGDKVRGTNVFVYGENSAGSGAGIGAFTIGGSTFGGINGYNGGVGGPAALGFDYGGNIRIGSPFTVYFYLNTTQSLGLGVNPSSGTNVLAIKNGTAPSSSLTDSVQLYAEDVSSSSELKVRDEAGNITTLSPHNFSLFEPDPNDPAPPFSYFSENPYIGKKIGVDMLGAIRAIEQVTGKQFVYTEEIPPEKKRDWDADEELKRVEREQQRADWQQRKTAREKEIADHDKLTPKEKIEKPRPIDFTEPQPEPYLKREEPDWIKVRKPKKIKIK